MKFPKGNEKQLDQAGREKWEQRKQAYLDSAVFLQDVLKQIITEGVAKKSDDTLEIPMGPNGRPLPGYQNMSAIMIRLNKTPRYWKDPSINKIDEVEKNFESKMKDMVSTQLQKDGSQSATPTI